MGEGISRRFVLIKASPDAIPPFARSGHGRADQVDPPAEQADQLADRLADAWVAEAELPMLGFHYVDKALRQRNRQRIAVLAQLLEADNRKRRNRREHRKAPVERVRNAALDIPMRLARLRSHRIEQRRAAR